MNHDERNEQSGPYRHFRSSLDLGMGVFYIAIGIAVWTLRFFGNIELSATYSYIFGGAMVLYGLFRLYRGVQGLRMKKRRNAQRGFQDINNPSSDR